VLVVQQNWLRGLVNELHVVVIVSQVPENVCKQSRKTVIIHLISITVNPKSIQIQLSQTNKLLKLFCIVTLSVCLLWLL